MRAGAGGRAGERESKGEERESKGEERESQGEERKRKRREKRRKGGIEKGTVCGWVGEREARVQECDGSYGIYMPSRACKVQVEHMRFERTLHPRRYMQAVHRN